MMISVLNDRPRLALAALNREPGTGISTSGMNLMEHAHLERLANASPGDYARDPIRVYRAAQEAVGACMIWQWIPENPLTMGDQGYQSGQERTATTGARVVERDGIAIESPESVLEHLETIRWPALRKSISDFDEGEEIRKFLQCERTAQDEMGSSILKTGYGGIVFPHFRYGEYGYENYFMAYALYPDMMETDFSIQADYAEKKNAAVVKAYAESGLFPFHVLDHDMADSRGTLVKIESLDKIWFPHFARAIQPAVDMGMELLWHCDGNLMKMVPRLIDVGLSGFQGFQYEDGMDYEAICKMKTKTGNSLLILAGVSVTTTLPHGTPEDVKKQLKWLVDTGPKTGLFLGASSSVTPGVPWENLRTLIDGLHYYRTLGGHE